IGPRFVDFFAVDADTAVGRSLKPRDDREYGRFSAAGMSKDAQEFRRLRDETHIFHRGVGSGWRLKYFSESRDFYWRHHTGSWGEICEIWEIGGQTPNV